MQFFVCTLTRKTVTVEGEPWRTVKYIKKQFQQKEGKFCPLNIDKPGLRSLLSGPAPPFLAGK
jgi:hypothetical protein